MNLRKRVSHIWYYYKIPIIIIICVVSLVVYTIKYKLDQESYDHSIAIVSKYNYPSQENLSKIVDAFSTKYGGRFEAIVYNVELGAKGEDEVLISKLSIDLSKKISNFYLIEDINAFKKAISSDIEFSDIALVKDIDWLNNYEIDNFYFLIRK